MEKLKFEDIATYLPFGLAYAKITEKSPVTLKPEIELQGILSTKGDIHNINQTVLSDYSQSGFEYKPILRSFHCLCWEIEHNGKQFVPIIELLKIKFQDWIKDKTNSRYSEIEVVSNPNRISACFSYMANYSIDVEMDTRNIPYWIIQKLHEWKFDVNGLIEKELSIGFVGRGLALDVEKIIINPYK